jgi:hypothetical protein
MHAACTSCCGISSRIWLKQVLNLAKVKCFVQPTLAKVYFQTKLSSRLRSGDNASQLHGEKNQANCLPTSLGFVRRHRSLLETKIAFSMQVFGIFEQMIVQNMLDLIILVDFSTRFYEK